MVVVLPGQPVDPLVSDAAAVSLSGPKYSPHPPPVWSGPGPVHHLDSCCKVVQLSVNVLQI